MPDMFHVLSHRAYVIVILPVVVHILHSEVIITEGAVLLLVEPVVFHVGLNAVVFHEFVVLFAAVARVGTYFLGQLAPTGLV